MSLLPASIKRIGPKTTEKRWRHHYPHYKSMGAFCCHGNRSFDPICPKTLSALSPTPMMLHIKFDQNWPKFCQVQKCEIFITHGRITPKWVVWFGPKLNSTELLCLSWLPATLMMIQSKMNALVRHHFPIRSLWEIFRRMRAANSLVSGPIWPKFKLVKDFMHVLVTCKYKKGSDQKQRRKGGDIIFPIISQWGLSVAMETRVLIQSAPKPYAAFPHPQWCYK